MSVISSVVNFGENLNKNLSYCNLLLSQMTAGAHDIKVCEHAAIASSRNVLSRICEGYQFIIAFSGVLMNTNAISEKLTSCGYRFTDYSDAELALFSYIHSGTKSPELLSGNFSYIIYDSMRRRIFAAVDRSASVPLFYSHSDGEFLLSTCPGGMFAHHGISPKITPDGVCELLSLSFETSGNIFDNILPVPPSHFIEITASGIEKKHYSPSSPEASPRDIAKKYLDIKPEKIGVFCTGSDRDTELFRLIYDCGYDRQVTAYSQKYYDIYKEYSADWQSLSLCEESVMTALEHSVALCGLPYLSCTDFLFAHIFRRFCSPDQLIFATYPGDFTVCGNHKVLHKNNALHLSVAETISVPGKDIRYIPNVPGILAQNCGMSLAQVLAEEAQISGFAKTQLRHILLSIISKDTAPILAFFRRGALLRLCEGNFDFSGTCLSEESLIAYIIKLNIWFEKYRPIIL